MRCLGWLFERIRDRWASTALATDLPVPALFWSHSTDPEQAHLPMENRKILAKLVLRFACSHNQNAVDARLRISNLSYTRKQKIAKNCSQVPYTRCLFWRARNSVHAN